jgi:hypothetical protein
MQLSRALRPGPAARPGGAAARARRPLLPHAPRAAAPRHRAPPAAERAVSLRAWPQERAGSMEELVAAQRRDTLSRAITGAR